MFKALILFLAALTPNALYAEAKEEDLLTLRIYVASIHYAENEDILSRYPVDQARNELSEQLIEKLKQTDAMLENCIKEAICRSSPRGLAKAFQDIETALSNIAAHESKGKSMHELILQMEPRPSWVLRYLKEKLQEYEAGKLPEFPRFSRLVDLEA